MSKSEHGLSASPTEEGAATCTLDVDSDESDDEPVAIFWSPRTPSQIPKPGDCVSVSVKVAVNQNTSRPIVTSASTQQGSYAPSPANPSKRIAHTPKPTQPTSKNKRPRLPTGQSKKVPFNMRPKYLDMLIEEYLKSGMYTEEECYARALKEEQALAARAATQSIYINLIAVAKKRIREKAGLLNASIYNSTPGHTNASAPCQSTSTGNPCVSHEAILAGRGQGTYSIERQRTVLKDPKHLTPQELYQFLKQYLVPYDELTRYDFPILHPSNPACAEIPNSRKSPHIPASHNPRPLYTCIRCKQMYKVTEDRIPIQSSPCIHHIGRLWNQRINSSFENRYSCCKGEPMSGGCSSAPYHVHEGEYELENYEGFVPTFIKADLDPHDHGVYALDCEMCYTTIGLELTRVTVVNTNFEVVYESLVKPRNPILDYNSKFSGINEGDLDNVHVTINDVQTDLLELFSSKTILVGHSLSSDMKTLKLLHPTVIDTTHLFPHKKGLPFRRKLKTLVQENLKLIIQEDVGHDSKEDAVAALKLVLWKLKTDVPPKA